MIRARRLGLRTRATLAFSLTALAVSVLLADVTQTLARGYLIERRQEAAARQAYVHARLARTVLRLPAPDLPALLSSLSGGTASQAVLRYRDEWFATALGVGNDAIPSDLLRIVTEGHAGSQRFRDPAGDLYLAIGVPIPAVDASYFELFPLADLEHALAVLARSLAIGVAAATLAAAAIGRAAANRLVRPLRSIADAAERIAAGALDTRLVPEPDRDLQRLVAAFNSMTESLQTRLERERRFAADVSHEMRSPLAAIAAALQVIDRRRSKLPDEVVLALDVLAAKVDAFQKMVLDLLEISRADAATADLDFDIIDLHRFLTQLVRLNGNDELEVHVADGAPATITGDRRRLAQAIGNVLENASRYAGGVTGVTVEPGPDSVVRILVDDAGPGVDRNERDAIFGRFARGDAGVRAGSTSGTGLGLALAAEHVALHRGRIWVEDAPQGGARFVVELPCRHP